MSAPKKGSTRSGRVNRDDPGIADLARGANGLGEPLDMQEIGRSMMAAQIEAMNTMFTASMSATARSLASVAQFWGAALPRSDGRRDKDGDE
ncbi:hypothetical protein ACOXXX_16405 [Thalassococcus sp. BH17M4-6]|uniref:hypothetical protein n=1 Tax=Thalassococcus sp. BH17M4-6 TaxID=3413148 RepID=UPI003BE91C25